jgi:CRISPR system Cascade subunit CasA
MNLVSDPWIPVIFEHGDPRLVGLEELYERASEIMDLLVTPPQRVSVMRLLLCISQAALDGPKDESDWLSCRDRLAPDSLKYLQSRKSRFELYGEQPFLQVKDLEQLNNATLDKLDFGLASGNNHFLFDHEARKEGRPHPNSWIALMLLTYQCFSPGGRIGVSQWAGKKTGTGSSDHAPCLESSPMHSVIRGARLLDTIYLNLLTREQVTRLPNTMWGVPVWDAFPESQNSSDAQALTHSYLGRLVPIPRAILLEPDSAKFTLANGLTYPKLPAGRETMVTVYIRGKKSKQEQAYLRVNPSRHPWRELGSLLNLNRIGEVGAALALDHLQNVRDGTIDLWVGGMATNQAKVVDLAEWNLALPLTLLYTAELRKYQRGVDFARIGEGSLGYAILAYGKHLGMEDQAIAGIRQKAILVYWTTLDNNNQMLVDIACAVERDVDEWRSFLVKTVHEAYRQACPHNTARQIQAFAAGQRLLRIKNPEE